MRPDTLRADSPNIMMTDLSPSVPLRAERIPPASAAYLRDTPIADWLAERKLRTVETVRAEALRHGLQLHMPIAINSPRYTLTNQGQEYKCGSLNLIAAAIEKFAADKALRR